MKSKNFSSKELSCKHCGEVGVNPSALDMLQQLRDLWGKPMIINSAYRCPSHPEEIKKEKAGTHAQGLAFDIKATPAEQIQLIPLAIQVGFKGFGLHQSFLHVDAREQNRISAWYY